MKNCRTLSTTTRGFTLLECLVCLTIISIIMLLLLPAIQAARESARRAHCINNLRQYGIAIHQYISTHNYCPSGNFAPYSYSIHSQLLNYMDAANIYNSFNFSKTSDQVAILEQHTALYATPGFLFCPSDSQTAPGLQSGQTNYAVCSGDGTVSGDNGFYSTSQSITLSAITDGTHSTVAMSEWLTGITTFDSLRYVYPSSNPLGPPIDAVTFYSSCKNSPSQEKAETFFPKKGFFWLQSDYFSTIYNHFIEPNNKSCQNSFRSLSSRAITASSSHNRGVNLLMVDGHVQSTKDSINLSVWRSLSTRSGSEVLGEY